MKAINAVWLAKTDLTNLNSGIGGSNLVDVKKYKANGKDFPYVSGQAMRYYWKEAIRRENQTKDSENQNITTYCVADDKGETCGKIEDCILDDLFGFMTTLKERGAVVRVSPIKMSPAMGMFSLQDNLTIDFLTRRKNKVEEGDLSGDIVNVELTVNLYKAGFSIDVVKVGGEEEIDPVRRQTKGIVYKTTGDVRKKRLIAALTSFKNISDFSKQARGLTDFSPDIILLNTQNQYNHLLQKALDILSDTKDEIKVNTKRLSEVLSDLPEGSKIYAGIISGIFSNQDEIEAVLKKLNVTITTPMKAIDNIISVVSGTTIKGNDKKKEEKQQ